MKLIVNYVVQGEKSHRYNSEPLELKSIPLFYSPEPRKSYIESEIVKWVEQQQCSLKKEEKIVVLKILKA